MRHMVPIGNRRGDRGALGLKHRAVCAAGACAKIVPKLCQTEEVTAATFFTAIVLALALGLVLGASLAGLWMRNRRSPEAAPDESTKPLADALARLEAQIRDFELQRQRSLGGLQHHLTSLSKETVALSQALRSPNTRGRWGELTLRRVAELAGMAPYCDFTEQETVNGSRPDMIVKLPGGRMLPVDAKAPLSAYLDAEAASDDASRRIALDRHAQQLSRHVLTLSGREYWSGFDTAPEMVVLFLPGDHFLSAALERDPELLDRALAKKVLVATPVTLISVLKGVAYGWRQERLAKNADELRRVASEFYDRMRIFAESYAASGRELAKAVEAYNRSARSWESRLEPSLRRMRELGVGGSAEVPEPQRIDTVPRELSIPVATTERRRVEPIK
jgi:DNA recombination protein RmuC